MKLFIVADIEGVAGVARPEQCRPGNPEYELARALMEGEVNAAIEGAIDSGATRIVVADSHASMSNLRADHIHPFAELVHGKPRRFSMAEGLADDEFDAIAFIGLHAPAGVAGVLAHTINGRAFHRVELNGELVGETDLYAAYACECGVPLVLVSGDDRLAAWGEERHPQALRVVVKQMQATWSARSLSPQASRERIRQAMRDALAGGRGEPQPRFFAPYRLKLVATQPVLADAFSMLPGVERLDAQSIGFTSNTVGETIALLGAASLLAGSLI
ncbi:M55 family metallopeptidase [Halotalea alkalilenta]|uniref:M55 family metallopeptidase n=1 Tax=Halotalea alkalilenta TaxID=376489 RepID=UPI00047F2EF8|nr:M55 family metallopeptidase [Halotalea alkalilenta]